jgi:polyhydroxybutyrate depolymerase
VRALVAVVALSLTLAACTRDGDGSRAEPSASATPTASASVGDAKGCGSVPDDVTGGTRDVTRTIDVDGSQRSYVVHVPPGYDGRRALPVVYLFHGLGSNAPQVLTYSGFPTVADERDFIVVAPQALEPRREWDVMATADQPRSDAAFWLQLSERLGDEWCVDADRQFAAGMSNGSAVVFAMACRGVYPFRAYGGVAATFYDQAACGDAPPTSFIYFHGTGDEVVPYQGGETPIFPVRAVQTVLGDWAGHDGCAREPRRQDVASDVVRETWRGCSDGSRLQAYVIDDGGHTWPGAGFEVPVLGKTTSSIDATRLMADFFGLKAP